MSNRVAGGFSPPAPTPPGMRVRIYALRVPGGSIELPELNKDIHPCIGRFIGLYFDHKEIHIKEVKQ
jgi:hypothetical protein